MQSLTIHMNVTMCTIPPLVYAHIYFILLYNIIKYNKVSNTKFNKVEI